MILSNVPNIPFLKTAKVIKYLNEVLNRTSPFLEVISFENLDVLKLFLNNSFKNKNLIEDIDYSFFDISNLNKEELFSLRVLETNNKDKLYVYVTKEKNEDILEFISQIKETKEDFKIILGIFNYPENNFEINENISLKEETSIRKYISQQLRSIDKNKMTRLLTEQIYKEFIENKNKIETLKNYSEIIENFDTLLLETLKNKNNKNILEEKETIEDIVNHIEENLNSNTVVDYFNQEKTNFNTFSLVILISAVISFCILYFIF